MESASQQSLNALETALENLAQQLNASVMLFNKQQSKSHNILDEKIELLNSSSQEQFMQLLELNNSYSTLLFLAPVLLSLPPPLQDTTGHYLPLAHLQCRYTVISTGSVGVVGSAHGLV